MALLRTVSHQPGDGHPDYVFFCPACRYGHGVWVKGPNQHTGATWSFNGNLDKPSFSPSIKVTTETWVPPVTPENLERWKANPWTQTKKVNICHSFVTDGVIHFCGDCTHGMAGKSIPLEEF